MSLATNKPDAANPAMAFWLAIEDQRRRVADLGEKVSKKSTTRVSDKYMNTRPVYRLGILLACCLTAPSLVDGAAETNTVPKTLKAFIGGPNGPDYRVELREGVLLYIHGHPGIAFDMPDAPGNPAPIKIAPTEQQWLEFRRSLNAINVWQWRTNYPNPGSIRDGTQWSLEIQYNDRTLTTRGDNNFPGLEGKPSGRSESRQAFVAYMAAITNLLGREFH